jgi:hypothetical protein
MTKVTVALWLADALRASSNVSNHECLSPTGRREETYYIVQGPGNPLQVAIFGSMGRGQA